MIVTTPPSCLHHGRSGFAYVLILGAVLIVTIIGLSVITIIRIQGRAGVGERDLQEAGTLAFAGVEHALHAIGNTPDWRTQFHHGVTGAEFPLGRGTCSWLPLDELDGNLANNPNDPVIVIATGVVSHATYRARVEIEFTSADHKPLVKPNRQRFY